MQKSKLLRSLLTVLAMLSVLALSGCGRSLVITTGFGRSEVFRVGSSRCRIQEFRVYMLDLQKQNESLYGSAIWESAGRDALQQSVKDEALSQLTHVKALGCIGVSRNVMLTTAEERLAEEAEHMYYEGLSEAEKKYINTDESGLQRMYREYALADKVYRSLGDEAESVYNQFMDNTQCDLNTKYWQKISLKKTEGSLTAPGFSECYRTVFAGQDGEDSGEGSAETGEDLDTDEDTVEEPEPVTETDDASSSGTGAEAVTEEEQGAGSQDQGAEDKKKDTGSQDQGAEDKKKDAEKQNQDAEDKKQDAEKQDQGAEDNAQPAKKQDASSGKSAESEKQVTGSQDQSAEEPAEEKTKGQ